MIFDFHTHIFSREVINHRDLYLDDPNFHAIYSLPDARMIDQHELLMAMEQNGISRSVAMGFPWQTEKNCEKQNRYFSSLGKESSGTIIPFGSIPIKMGVNVESWVRSIREQGLSGIGEIALYHEGFSSRHIDLLEKILNLAAENRLPVCLHVNEPIGHRYAGKYETSFIELWALIQRCPGVTLVLAHWGGGIFFYELMPEIKKGLSNVYYDTAASPLLYDNKIYSIAVNIASSEKILFGSDYPLIKPSRYIEPLRRENFNTEVIDNILSKNSLRILHLDDA